MLALVEMQFNKFATQRYADCLQQLSLTGT